MKILGVGPDQPTVESVSGGKQSLTEYRFDLLPRRAAFGVARVLKAGAEKYGEWNWVKINKIDHINHALIHIFAHLEGDIQDDHLANAVCRLMFAYSE